MPASHVFVPGGGNTYIQIGTSSGAVLDFMSEFNDTPGAALGQATDIQPIGHRYPVEIVTPYGQQSGTITLTVWKKWEHDAWVSAFLYDINGNAFDTENPWSGYETSNGQATGEPVDLAEVLDAQRKLDNNIVVKKLELAANGKAYRAITYKGAVITNITPNGSVKGDTMSATTVITIKYTHIVTTIV